jgi:nucleotidyltransferase substrate binding protein (TIGR01987 family)
MDRLKERLEIASKALLSLREALRETVTPMNRDASIQRFGYTYEAVWKAAQLYLRSRENLELASPTSVTRACFQAAVLNEEQGRIALDMARDRNLTVHTYNEELADQIYSRLAAYAGLMEHWLATMRERTGSGDESLGRQ